MVNGPLLIKVAADDDRAAETDDEAQQREGCVALHAANDAECLFHVLFVDKLIHLLLLARTVPKQQSTDSLQDMISGKFVVMCGNTQRCAEKHGFYSLMVKVVPLPSSLST